MEEELYLLLDEVDEADNTPEAVVASCGEAGGVPVPPAETRGGTDEVADSAVPAGSGGACGAFGEDAEVRAIVL